MSSFTTKEYYSQLTEAAEYVKAHLGQADVAVVLGSGLNNFTTELSNAKELPYHQIPHMPTTSVKGHAGKMVLGDIDNKKIICLAGRVHGYEGYEMYQLNFTARLLALLGVKLLIATNAAGGSQKGMYPGCLMIITDHINFYRRNPLADTASHDGLVHGHPSFAHLYSTRIAEIAKRVSKDLNIHLFEGVYGATSGPAYETPSEVISFTKMGASSFGMSTIPETMAAGAMGLEVFAMSLITNLAAGMSDEILTHGAVTEVAESTAPAFVNFMKKFLSQVDTKEVKLPKAENPVYNVLPFPRAHTAQPSQVDQIASAIPSAKIAIYAAKGHSITLENSKEISSPPFHIQYGTLNKRQVLVFQPFEDSMEISVLFSQVLNKLNVNVLIHTFALGGVKADMKKGDLVQIVDVVDSTTIHAVADVKKQYMLSRKPVDTKSYQQLPTVTYMYFQGPSFPTPSEVAIAKQIGVSSVGITPLSTIYACRSLDIDVIAIGQVSWIEINVQDCVTGNVQLAVTNLVGQVNIERNKTVESVQVRKQQISNYLALPVTQGNYEEVQEAAEFVKKQVCATSAAIAIVVDTDLCPHFNLKLESPTELAYSAIPHFPGSGKLVYGKHEGVPTFLLYGTSYINEGLPSGDIVFGVHLLSALTVEKVVFVTPLVSVSKEIEVGSVAIIRDHVSLSGRSSIFGHNEERWGTRFPDVSEAYDAHLQEKLVEGATKLDLNSRAVVVTQVIGPVFGSKLDAHYAAEIETQAMCTGMVPEVVAARHCKLLVGAVGAVTMRFVDEEPQEVDAKQVVEKVEKLISFVIKS